MMPIGNMRAPAIKKPHKPPLKHVKMCVNHAATLMSARASPM